MATKRINEKQNTTRVREAVSPITIIDWDPVANDGVLQFYVQDIVIEDGVVVGLRKNAQLRPRADHIVMVERKLSDLFQQIIRVDTGGGQFVDVPALVVVGALKALFDTAYNEDVDAQQAGVVIPPPKGPAPVRRIPDALRARLALE